MKKAIVLFYILMLCCFADAVSQNVTIKGNNSLYGLVFDYCVEACVSGVTIEGFDYGIKTGLTSPVIFDDLDVSKNRIAGVLTKNANLNFNKVNWGENPAFEFATSNIGRYYVRDGRE